MGSFCKATPSHPSGCRTVRQPCETVRSEGRRKAVYNFIQSPYFHVVRPSPKKIITVGSMTAVPSPPSGILHDVKRTTPVGRKLDRPQADLLRAQQNT